MFVGKTRNRVRWFETNMLTNLPMTNLWDTLAGRAGLTLSARQHELLGRYLDLLLQANQTMNLTRIGDRPAAEIGHVADALTLLAWIGKDCRTLVDVGSGGGVPGLPLAIVRPEVAVTLIEATQKKAGFLQRAVGELQLANVTVLAKRAEEVGQSSRRETFDVAIVRAVALMDWLAEWCLPLVRVGGIMLAMKGKKAAEEVPAAGKAIRVCGGQTAEIHPAGLPGFDDHVIVQVRKIAPTPAKYPRLPTQSPARLLG